MTHLDNYVTQAENLKKYGDEDYLAMGRKQIWGEGVFQMRSSTLLTRYEPPVMVPTVSKAISFSLGNRTRKQILKERSSCLS